MSNAFVSFSKRLLSNRMTVLEAFTISLWAKDRTLLSFAGKQHTWISCSKHIWNSAAV